MPRFAPGLLFAAGAAARRCTPQYDAGQHVVEVSDASLGGHRQFVLVVPDGLPVGAPVPLVLGIHGFSSSPFYWEKLVGLAGTVDKFKWVGILPFGTAPDDSVTGATKCCSAGRTAQECREQPALDQRNPCRFDPAKDVAFARYIVSWAGANMCTDAGSVFATGFSNGGMMSDSLACEAADLFAAVAPGGGNTACDRPSRPVAWASVCGMSDGVCKDGVASTALSWARHNACDVAKGRVPAYSSATTACYRYDGCSDGAFVEWCEVAGLGHEWSGHVRPDWTVHQPPTNIDATRFFFDKFSLAVGNRGGAVLNATR